MGCLLIMLVYLLLPRYLWVWVWVWVFIIYLLLVSLYSCWWVEVGVEVVAGYL